MRMNNTSVSATYATTALQKNPPSIAQGSILRTTIIRICGVGVSHASKK